MPHLSAFLRPSFARHLLLASALLCGAFAQAAPTGLLNDTGQTQCADANNNWVACSASATNSDAGTRPRQDGRFGRDVGASPAGKAGGGAAGFDFTPLDASGNAIALAGTPDVPVATPRCVKDNVTNLIWEVKTTTSPASGLQDTTWVYSWGSNTDTGSCGSAVSYCNTVAYIAALNVANLCGETANDWRLPTRRELLSIVHWGLTSGPVIDTSYFPATQSTWYWTSDTDASNSTKAWAVYFDVTNSPTAAYTGRYPVRLVRSGP